MKKLFFLISLMVMNFVAANAGTNSEELFPRKWGKFVKAEVAKTLAENGKDYLYTICLQTETGILPVIIRNNQLEVCIKSFSSKTDENINGFWWDGFKWETVHIDAIPSGFRYNTGMRPKGEVSMRSLIMSGDTHPLALSGSYKAELTKKGRRVIISSNKDTYKIKVSRRGRTLKVYNNKGKRCGTYKL